MTGRVALLFVAAVVLHGAWALTIPVPEDWDAQYYLAVARHLAGGDGAVTLSLWNLSILPETLPLAADLHWMPGPARVLVPGVWLWPAHGDQLVTVLLAACWVPIAWALAKDLGASPSVALGAAALCASGGVYARLLSTPDCYALYGVCGGIGLVAVARDRLDLVVVAAVAASLIRNDGFLLGLCLAVGARHWAPAVAALTATAAWSARSAWIGGDDWWHARAIASSSGEYLAMYDGVLAEPLSVGGRLAHTVAAWPEVLEVLVTPGLIVLTPLIGWAAWRHRRRPWVPAFLLFVLGTPVVTLLLAPAVAQHGTLYRSGAAMFPGHMALAAVGLALLSDAAERHRGYPRAFLPCVLGSAFLVISQGVAWQGATALQRPPECALVAEVPPEAPIFTSRPLEMELLCGRPGIMLTRTTPLSRVTEVARRYDVQWAVVSPDAWLDEGSVAERHVRRVLPSWEPASTRLFRAPRE